MVEKPGFTVFSHFSFQVAPKQKESIQAQMRLNCSCMDNPHVMSTSTQQYHATLSRELTGPVAAECNQAERPV